MGQKNKKFSPTQPTRRLPVNSGSNYPHLNSLVSTLDGKDNMKLRSSLKTLLEIPVTTGNGNIGYVSVRQSDSAIKPITDGIGIKHSAKSSENSSEFGLNPYALSPESSKTVSTIDTQSNASLAYLASFQGQLLASKFDARQQEDLSGRVRQRRDTSCSCFNCQKDDCGVCINCLGRKKPGVKTKNHPRCVERLCCRRQSSIRVAIMSSKSASAEAAVQGNGELKKSAKQAKNSAILTNQLIDETTNHNEHERVNPEPSFMDSDTILTTKPMHGVSASNMMNVSGILKESELEQSTVRSSKTNSETTSLYKAAAFVDSETGNSVDGDAKVAIANESEISNSVASQRPTRVKRPVVNDFVAETMTSAHRVRCKKCLACFREECRMCYACKGKKKYGGDGKSRQSRDPCIFRRCLVIYPPDDGKTDNIDRYLAIDETYRGSDDDVPVEVISHAAKKRLRAEQREIEKIRKLESNDTSLGLDDSSMPNASSRKRKRMDDNEVTNAGSLNDKASASKAPIALKPSVTVHIKETRKAVSSVTRSYLEQNDGRNPTLTSSLLLAAESTSDSSTLISNMFYNNRRSRFATNLKFVDTKKLENTALQKEDPDMESHDVFVSNRFDQRWCRRPDTLYGIEIPIDPGWKNVCAGCLGSTDASVDDANTAKSVTSEKQSPRHNSASILPENSTIGTPSSITLISTLATAKNDGRLPSDHGPDGSMSSSSQQRAKNITNSGTKKLADSENDEDVTELGSSNADVDSESSSILKENPNHSTTIVLCDGNNCGREYHLGCCTPVLTDVPEAEHWLCQDCCPNNSTASLKRYFEVFDENKASYYSDQHVRDNHANEQKRNGTHPNSASAFPDYVFHLLTRDSADLDLPRECDLPISELERCMLTTEHALAVPNEMKGMWKKDNESNAEENKGPSSSRKATRTSLLPARVLLGKPLRVYDAFCNDYHTGRIVDYRKAINIEPSMGVPVCATANPTDVAGGLPYDSVEYLIRFAAGKDNRKSTYYHWIVLEEHALAVGLNLVWSRNQPRSTVWKPSIMWFRTARELVPVQHLLDAERGEIFFRTRSAFGSETMLHPVKVKKKAKRKAWALVRSFGQEEYALIDTKQNSIDFKNESAIDRFKTQETILSFQAAEVERLEQDRVQRWHGLDVATPTSAVALSSRDYYGLPKLIPGNGYIADLKSFDKLTSKSHSVHLLCSNVSLGINRSLLVDLIKSRTKIEPTKDTAASLVCDISPLTSEFILRESKHRA